MAYTAWCNEADCAWEEAFDSHGDAVEGLAQHCLDQHPEVALTYPVVQEYARRIAARAAPTNGVMTRKSA